MTITKVIFLFLNRIRMNQKTNILSIRISPHPCLCNYFFIFNFTGFNPSIPSFDFNFFDWFFLCKYIHRRATSSLFYYFVSIYVIGIHLSAFIDLGAKYIENKHFLHLFCREDSFLFKHI